MYRNRKLSGFWHKTLLLFGVFILILVVSAVAFRIIISQNVINQVTVEAGTEMPEINDFINRDYGVDPSFISDASVIDMHETGEYLLRMRYFGLNFDVTLLVQDTTPPAAEVAPVTAFAIELPNPEAFIVKIDDVTAVTVAYASSPDPEQEGEQTVTLLLTDEAGNTAQLQTTLELIFDRESPVIQGVAPLSIFLGQEADYLGAVSALDNMDDAPLLTVDDSNVDLTAAGKYEILYTCIDFFGNKAIETTTLTIIEDNTPPVILGANPISLYAGSSVAYRKGILVTDDLDESPKLTVDSSQVDLRTPGTYQVTYTATDAAGNQSSITTSVTVAEKPDTYIDEETIYAAADEVLARIITEDMTDRQKVEAIYKWLKRNCVYTSTSDKNDWLQEAYHMICNHRGDCFSYYSVSRLFFERLYLPNITVLRSEESRRGGHHYWNMVSIDGGITYYHFDSTPTVSTRPRDGCLMTDAALDAYDRICPGYYTRDLSLYPPTPEE